MSSMMVFAGISFALLMANVTFGVTPTFIESAPGGKRVLEVTDSDVTSTATGKIVYHIQGNEILSNIHDPAVLVVDDDDVRHTAAGLKLATFDGEDIRHGKAGKVVMNYHHPDICPDSQSNRIYTVNGPQLSKQQLVAVLYTLKPELFQLTDAERTAQEKAIAEAAAEQDKLDHADPVVGGWDVLNGHGPAEKMNKGTITFTKKGDGYPVVFDYTPDGGKKWTGAGVYRYLFGDKLVFAAYGTEKTVGLCVYEIDGGNLKGTWYPWYIDGDAKNTGTEVLKGPESLDGEFQIVSAKAPSTGAAYAGTVTIKPLTIVGSPSEAAPYEVTWDFAGTKIHGIGLKSGKILAVASGTGEDVLIGKFLFGNGSFNGDFFKLGSTDLGGMAAMSK